MILKPKEGCKVQYLLSIPVLMCICYLVRPPQRKSSHTGSSLNQTVCSGCISTAFRTSQNVSQKTESLCLSVCALHKPQSSLSPSGCPERQVTCAPLYGRHTRTQLYTLMHCALHLLHQLDMANLSCAAAVCGGVSETLCV